MTLPLYAGPGDVIVTGETWITALFRKVDPSGEVRVMTWQECVAMLKNS